MRSRISFGIVRMVADAKPWDGLDPSTRTTLVSRQPRLRKLLNVQEKLEDDINNPEVEPRDRASCARAWKELEMLRRVMLGKPTQVHPAIQLKIPKARKFGMLRSVQAEIVDVETTLKAPENATSGVQTFSPSETAKEPKSDSPQ